jgi:hypothetical protein
MARGNRALKNWLIAAGGVAALGAAAFCLLHPSGGRQKPSQLSALNSQPISSRIYPATVPIERTLYATNAKGEPLISPLPTVDRVIDFSEPLPFEERMEILHSQKGELTAIQLARLAAFVRDNRRPEDLSPEELRALKNDILNLLARQDGYRDQLAALLRTVHEDAAQDAVMRDYALQFLAMLMQDSRLPSDYALHWRAVEGNDPSLAATALVHLLLASEEKNFPTTERRKLADAAFQMAADSKMPAPSRATALRVCAQLGESRALPVAYGIARSEKETFPLRIAAIAALGDLSAGDAKIKTYLQQLRTGREQRLRVPAASALQRLDNSKS